MTFIDESRYGKRFQDKPFVDKRFLLTPSFIVENRGKQFDALVCETLIEKVSLYALASFC